MSPDCSVRDVGGRTLQVCRRSLGAAGRSGCTASKSAGHPGKPGRPKENRIGPTGCQNVDAAAPSDAFLRLRGSGPWRRWRPSLGLTSGSRNPLFPDVPTVAESGLPGFETGTYWGLVAPAATPAPVLAKLREATQRFFASAPERERLTQAGFVPIAGDAAAFDRIKAEESAKWGRLIKERGIKVT